MKIFTYKIFMFFFFLLWSFNAYTQNNIIDSLQNVLQTEKEDTNKVNTLIELSRALRNDSDYKNAQLRAEEELSLSEKLNYKKGQATANAQIGWNYHVQKMDTIAVKYLFMSLKIREEIGDKPGAAQSYQDIAEVYSGQGNYPEVLVNYFSRLKIKNEIGDKPGIADTYAKIAYTYFNAGNYPEALKNGYATLKLNEELGNKQGMAEAYNIIGAVYDYQQNNSEALKNLFASLKIYEEIGNKEGIGQAYMGIGDIYSRQGKYTEAFQEHFAAFKIFQEPGMPGYGIPTSYLLIGKDYEGLGDVAAASGNKTNAANKFSEAQKNYLAAWKAYDKTELKEGVALAYVYLGTVNIKLKKLSTARDYLEKGLKLSTAIRKKELLQDGYRGLSNLDSIEGNYKQAYEHYKMYTLYRDSLVNEESTKKMLRSNMQYEYDKKETVAKAAQEKKDIEAKRVKNLQYFVIGGLGIVMLAVLLIAFIQWRNNKQKKKANTLLTQQKEKVESTLSELKSTQSQLIQSEKMASLGELTAGIAHEIQNPLNFVNNFSEVSNELIDEMNAEIEKGDIGEAKAIAGDIKQNLEKINHHGKRADAIVKGMLQHSRSSSGTKELTDINALADEYLRLAYHGLRAKDKSFNATTKTDFDESIGNINIIPQDIGRAILNLITNAFYAASLPPVIASKAKQGGFPDSYKNDNPTVWVSTKKNGDKVIISVKDNGPGIPQKIVDKIFQPFFTTKPTGQGTGLGLSLSYDIVKAHGGELKVETKEGQGTAFTICLPLN